MSVDFKGIANRVCLSDPIIVDPDDTDFYKLTMKAAVFKLYSDVQVEYAFTCRTPGFDFRSILPLLRDQITKCGELRYSEEALTYIGALRNPEFSLSFLRFLSQERWNPLDVSTECDNEGALHLRVAGPWLYTIDWEVWLLSIISELRTWSMSLDLRDDELAKDIRKRQMDKLMMLRNRGYRGYRKDFGFTDFGTRRRASKSHQEQVLKFWGEEAPGYLLGTSNIYFARKLGLKVFGTHAHEWDQAHLAFTHPLNAKRVAMQRWLEVFGGDAGTTLTDTFTTRHFFTVFDKMMANAFTGVRHDSGSVYSWAEQMLQHYERLGIDPKTKTLLFSDGLNFQKMVEIYDFLRGRCRIGFGIGTNLMNDLSIPALQIVIKMVSCNGVPVLKISDDPGKLMCEHDWLREYMLKTFEVSEEKSFDTLGRIMFSKEETTNKECTTGKERTTSKGRSTGHEEVWNEYIVSM